jgi:hypothetical protein
MVKFKRGFDIETWFLQLRDHAPVSSELKNKEVFLKRNTFRFFSSKIGIERDYEDCHTLLNRREDKFKKAKE